MKKWKPAIVLLMLFFPMQNVWAWGPLGHKIVGEIADRHLAPEVKIKIRKNFNIKKLADVANWADQVKKNRSQGAWHYCNIAESERVYDRVRDCPEKACVVEKIREFVRALEVRGSFHNMEKTQHPPSPQSSPPQGERKKLLLPRGEKAGVRGFSSKGRAVPEKTKREALMYLIHFVGDIHQPLHLGNAKDRGGNNISLSFKGRSTNLHALWDGGLIYLAGKSLVQYAGDLSRRVTMREAETWNLSPVTQWANESRVLALDHAYGLDDPGRGTLSKSYIERSREIIDLRLTQAGVRLAGLLNRLLK
jgi:nuclease S1